MKKIKQLAVAAIILILSLTSILAEVSTSSSFHIKSAVISSGGGSASLASYKLGAVVGQSSPVAESTATSADLVSGYLSNVSWMDHDGDGVYTTWEIANDLDPYTASDAGQFDLIAYSMGSDGSPAARPTLTHGEEAGADYLYLDYSFSKKAVGVSLKAEYSVDLQNWTEVDASNISLQSQDADRWSYQVKLPFAGSTKVFLRLNARGEN